MNRERVMDLARLTAELAVLATNKRAGWPACGGGDKPSVELTTQQIANDAFLLIRYASSLSNYAVQDCNVGLTEKQDKAVDSIRKRVAQITETYGVKATFSGDPRGYVTHLHFPSGIYNTMGGAEAGWGI